MSKEKKLWNYRVLASQFKGDVYLQIHEVQYDDDKNPISYTKEACAIVGDDFDDLNHSLYLMQEALKRPILWSSNKFPTEVKVRYKCLLCGRDTFTRKSFHNCNDGFRKRKIEWEVIYG